MKNDEKNLGRLLFTNGNYDCAFTDKSEEFLNKQVLEWLVSKTNRAVHQTKFLYNILGDWKLLLELEEACKVFSLFYCPGDYAECMYLLAKLRTWKACGWVKEKNEYTLL